MGARDKFETFKNIGTMNAGLVDSFQMAKCVLISIHWLIISFARMLGTTHVRVITHVLTEITVPFRVCSKPLPHEEVRRILEDPPESSEICNLPLVKPKPEGRSFY